VLLSDAQDGYRDASVALLQPRVSDGTDRAETAVEAAL